MSNLTHATYYDDFGHIPSFIRFLRPIVPILSQNDSSLSSFLGKTGVRGDFGRGEDILLDSDEENINNES